VAFSMAWQKQSCQQGQPAGGSALAELAGFRQELHRCLRRCPDALFELADAVLTAGPARSLPYLSLEPSFRRGHGMVYQALAGGRIDEEALRDLLVAWRPRSWPLAFAVDASTYPRPWAAASPGREWHHHSCPGNHGSDGAAVARRPGYRTRRAGPASTARAATGSSARTPPPGGSQTRNCPCVMSDTGR
jgi:hypothetical protein